MFKLRTQLSYPIAIICFILITLKIISHKHTKNYQEPCQRFRFLFPKEKQHFDISDFIFSLKNYMQRFKYRFEAKKRCSNGSVLYTYYRPPLFLNLFNRSKKPYPFSTTKLVAHGVTRLISFL